MDAQVKSAYRMGFLPHNSRAFVMDRINVAIIDGQNVAKVLGNKFRNTVVWEGMPEVLSAVASDLVGDWTGLDN